LREKEKKGMNFGKFSGKRWTVICGRYDGVEGYAVNELYKAIQQYVPYILTVNRDRSDLSKVMGHNMIFIGTASSNRYIKEFIEKRIIGPIVKKEGFTYMVCKNPLDPETQAIVIAGADENGVLYGVRDLEHYYLNSKWHKENYRYRSPKIMLAEDLPECTVSSSPAIENRGIWTWGHVIYDHRRFLDNMSKWKMNMIIIWNDCAPMNAKQIVEYAHSRGIKVIWGFSWCWGEPVDPNDPSEVVKWTKRVIDTYEEQYAGIGGDGIYFQTFTEMSDMSIGNKSVAGLVSDWVNTIADKLLERHPGLWIQFGIHASSIRHDLDKLKIDPRLSIVWEDAGSFPYAYDAAVIENAEETLEYTSKISELRGKDEDFGIIVKGCTTLDWTDFENQKGMFILGETKDYEVRKKADGKAVMWKYTQIQWIKNLRYVADAMKIISGKDIKRASASVLIEDGMWEEHMYCPGAFLAETLWDPYEDPEEIIRKTSYANDIYFV
jgi:hypothetical protein